MGKLFKFALLGCAGFAVYFCSVVDLTPQDRVGQDRATGRTVAENCTTHRDAFAAAQKFYRSTGGDRNPASQIFLDGKNSIEVTLIFREDGKTGTIGYSVAPDCSVKFA